MAWLLSPTCCSFKCFNSNLSFDSLLALWTRRNVTTQFTKDPKCEIQSKLIKYGGFLMNYCKMLTQLPIPLITRVLVLLAEAELYTKPEIFCWKHIYHGPRISKTRTIQQVSFLTFCCFLCSSATVVLCCCSFWLNSFCTFWTASFICDVRFCSTVFSASWLLANSSSNDFLSFSNLASNSFFS